MTISVLQMIQRTGKTATGSLCWMSQAQQRLSMEFTITGAFASARDGGGLRIEDGAAAVFHCLITGNRAEGRRRGYAHIKR